MFTNRSSAAQTAIEQIFAVVDSILFTLPHIFFWLVIAYTLYFFLRDRYRRILRLDRSPENRKIDEILRSGAISAAEAETLRAGCPDLPDPVETAPVPDKPLRLAAAYTLCFAWLYLLMFAVFGVYMGYYAYVKTLNVPHLVQTAPAGGHVWVLCCLSGPIFAASVCQLFAARRLLRGSLAARNCVFAVWLLYFITLGLIGTAYGSWLFAAVEALAGLAVLHILYFRKNAAAKIRTGSPAPSLRRRIILAVLVAASLFFGLCETLIGPGRIIPVNLTVTKRQVFSNFRTTRGNDLSARLEKLYIVAGTPDAATAEVAEALAKNLGTKLKIACEAVPFGVPLENVDMSRELALMVTSGTAVEKNKAASMFAAEIVGHHMNLASKANDFGGATVFEFRLLRPFGSESCRYKGLLFPQLDVGITGTVAIKGGNAEGDAAAAAGEIANKFLPLLEAVTGPATVAIPDLGYNNDPYPPPPDLGGLRNVRLVMRARSSSREWFEVYAFEKGDYDSDLAAAEKAMKSRGLSKQAGQSEFYGKTVMFEPGDRQPYGEGELYIGLRPGNGGTFGEVDADMKYGLLSMARSRDMNSRVSMQYSDLAKNFLREDVRGFVLCHGLTVIPPAERLDAMRKFFALKNLSWLERYEALSSLSGKLSEEELGIFRREYAVLLEETAAHADAIGFLSQAGSLRTLAERQDAQSLEPFMKIMAPHIRTVTVPAAKTPQWSKSVFVFPTAPDGGAQFLIRLDFEDKDYQSVWLHAGIAKSPDGRIQYSSGSMSSTSVPERDNEKAFAYAGWQVETWGRQEAPPFKLRDTSHGGLQSTPITPAYEFGATDTKNVMLIEFEFDQPGKRLQLTIYMRKLPKQPENK